MHFSLKPDFEKTMKRMDAFWACDLLDRPLINLSVQRQDAKPVPQKHYPDHDSRWLDIEFHAIQQVAELENREWMADSLPVAIPRLGPGIYSAWHGCPYHFTETTGWTDPIVEDWDAQMPQVHLDFDSPFFKLTQRYTRILLELGKGKFITGLTDIHMGADHLDALRGTENINMDLIDRPDDVEAFLAADMSNYQRVYDHFYQMIREGGSLASTWIAGLCGRGKFYVPSNDFSCMVSTAMYERFFLPLVEAECAFMDHTIYHLDGPNALRHLDMLLGVKRLNAIQWVCGAGNEGFERWIPVYQRIQKARKAMQLGIHVTELPKVFENLRPEGLQFSHIGGVYDRETAENVIKRISRWK